MSSEAAWRKRPEVAVYEFYAGESKQCAPVLPRTVYHLDIPRMRIVTTSGRIRDNGILFYTASQNGKNVWTIA